MISQHPQIVYAGLGDGLSGQNSLIVTIHKDFTDYTKYIQDWYFYKENSKKNLNQYSLKEEYKQLLNDLNTLTEFEDSSAWTMHYKGKEIPFTRDDFDKTVPLSPKAYRDRYEKDLNEMRVAAGMDVVTTYDKKDKSLQAIQRQQRLQST